MGGFMKVYKTLMLSLLTAVALGCGYSNPMTSGVSMPAISQLSPGSTTAGSAQFQLEVDGSNFSTSAVVNFNGTAQATTFVNTGKLEAAIPSAAVMTSGTVPVTVTNPATSVRYNMPATTSTPVNFMIN